VGNWHGETPHVLVGSALRALREGRPAGLSRRQLLRRSLAAAVGLWATELAGGTVGFLWPNVAGGFGGIVTAGTLEDLKASPAVAGLSMKGGAPAYLPKARAYVTLIDPALGLRDGESPDGDGRALNVRALWQRCPHLGCKPNFCPTSYRFECPCHFSRYDRLGTKVLELGPAARGLDRFATSVKDGVLTIDTSVITLGPLPLSIGSAGLEPPRSAQGCV
jgi:cytochrome b6-f complex iron-sulfur subunit